MTPPERHEIELYALEVWGLDTIDEVEAYHVYRLMCDRDGKEPMGPDDFHVEWREADASVHEH